MNKNKSSTIISLVWAKEPEIQYWWPAKISDEDDIDEDQESCIFDKKAPNSKLLYFFGIRSFSWVKDTHIKEFKSGANASFYEQDLPPNTIDFFKLALKEMNQLLNSNNSGGSNTNHNNNEDGDYSNKKVQHYDNQRHLLNKSDEDVVMTKEFNQDEQDGEEEDDNQYRHNQNIQYQQQQIFKLQQQRPKQQQQQNNRNTLPHYNDFEQDDEDQFEQEEQQDKIKTKKSIGTNEQYDEDDSSNLLTHLKRAREMAPSQFSLNSHKKHQENNHDMDDDQDDDEEDDDDDLKMDDQDDQSKKRKVDININNNDHLKKIDEQHQNNIIAEQSKTPSLSSTSKGEPNSPSMSAKRVLLIKPPRSPAIASRPNRPVIIGSSQNNNLSPSITQIANPINSPPTRSSQVLSSPPPLMVNKFMPTSPLLPSKLSQNVLSALMQKKNAPMPNGLPTQQPSPILQSASSPSMKSQPSPSMNPKAPITLNIPRFKKSNSPPMNNQQLNNNQQNSPSISSANNIVNNPSKMSPLTSSAIPFHIPQQFRKNVYSMSPSGSPSVGATNRMNGNNRVPNSPLLSVPMTPPLPPDAKLHTVDEDSSQPSSNNNNSVNQLQQGFPMFPFFSALPSFNSNSLVNMETSFTSPFNGKFAVKGSVETGFQIDCNIMGKSFQGFLTEMPSQPTASATGNTVPSPTSQQTTTTAANIQMNSFLQNQQAAAFFNKMGYPPNMVPPTMFNNNSNNSNLNNNNNSGKPMFNNNYRRNSVSTTEGLSFDNYQNMMGMNQWIESYRQWQDIVLKTQLLQQQQQFNQQLNNVNSPSNNNRTSPTGNGLLNVNNNVNSNSSNSNSNNSTQNTPMQTPKTIPSIQVNNKKEDTNTLIQQPISQHSDNPEFLSFKQNAFQKLEQYQKLQIINLLSKQEEAINSLLDTFEKEKAIATSNKDNNIDQDPDLVSKIQIKFKEDQEKLQQQHKDQRSKLDATHSYQATKFHREVEKQWLIQRNKGTSNGGAPLSPVGSPALTPFISPSPAPSPLLSSFTIGTSPIITPSVGPQLLKNSSISNNGIMLMKDTCLSTSSLSTPLSSSLNNNNNNNNNSVVNNSNNNSGNSTLNNNNNTNNNDSSNNNNTNNNSKNLTNSTSSQPPPLSLSSNSPPRSPNDKKLNSIINEKLQTSLSNNDKDKVLLTKSTLSSSKSSISSEEQQEDEEEQEDGEIILLNEKDDFDDDIIVSDKEFEKSSSSSSSSSKNNNKPSSSSTTKSSSANIGITLHVS
ncbi:hypothetical protein CYY_006326 [Polysphondylium violaceum]|uniref:PWWP domain-containing protein n=1 Tax=Polysphondylium violaceum TaxID=133409 RepID=A0A8J4Q093_9MYCE|nr:hypothetical protein CYY_006326 [Polysphondylium violaceum]